VVEEGEVEFCEGREIVEKDTNSARPHNRHDEASKHVKDRLNYSRFGLVCVS
jgi:hypothetical protein